MTDNIRVFCSHNSVDKPRVREVAERLAAAGIDPWVDQWEIAPGDDIVDKINQGLATCQAGLIFFSKQTLEKPWARTEVSSLTHQAIEDGKAVIPVMLDTDALVPELLRTRARVAGDDLERLIDAIYHRSGKPALAALRPGARERLFRVRLQATGEDELRVVAESDRATLAEEPARLGSGLRRSYREFLQASLPGVSRLSAIEAARRRDLDLARLGEALGGTLLPGEVGTGLATAIDRAVAGGDGLRLEFEAAPSLLALPFEATRLPDGRIAALEPGVQVLRRPAGLGAAPLEPLPGPLRLLVAVGAPDEGQTGNLVLDYERELQTILDVSDQARRYGNAEVKILEVGHPEEIQRALLARRYQVPHVSGYGGVGKSALAGRAMARLASDGWSVLARVGRWGLGELALAVGAQLLGNPDPALDRTGNLLLREDLPDPVRLQQLQGLLANHRVLLVLDNFEDNLTLGGGDFLDETTALVLAALLQTAQRGKVLITCRFPVPGTENWLADEPLGPLSPAETRKLFYRLPALTDEAPETLGLILRHIGGQPPMPSVGWAPPNDATTL